MNQSDSGGNAAAWAQLVLTILDEGRRTATYKLAVLLALIDCCALTADADGRAPTRIPVRDLAVRVLELYWPQVRTYARRDGAPLLRQSSQAKAVTVDSVQALREKASAASGRRKSCCSRTSVTGWSASGACCARSWSCTGPVRWRGSATRSCRRSTCGSSCSAATASTLEP